MSHDPGMPVRPAHVCKALLSALEASEGRRRRRKRDQTPDAIGLAIKRRLLEQAVREDPDPEMFEAWLVQCAAAIDDASEPVGAVSAMARSVFEDWHMAHVHDNFREWLDRGAPSEDVLKEK